MQMDLRMPLQPAVPLGLVGIQVVEDDVHLTIRVSRHDLIHKIQKLAPSAAGIMTGLNLACDYVQRCE